MTLLGTSAHTFKGLWNGCSRLPQQSKPTSPNIACLKGNNHLYPLGICPPPEQKTHSAWRGWTWPIPDLMATSSQASPCVVMPENVPSIIQVSHSASLPTVPKAPEVDSISPTPQSLAPLGLIQLTYQRRYFDCKDRWTWPWSGYSSIRPL